MFYFKLLPHIIVSNYGQQWNLYEFKTMNIDYLVRETKQGSEKKPTKNDAIIVQYISLCIAGF